MKLPYDRNYRICIGEGYCFGKYGKQILLKRKIMIPRIKGIDKNGWTISKDRTARWEVKQWWIEESYNWSACNTNVCLLLCSLNYVMNTRKISTAYVNSSNFTVKTVRVLLMSRPPYSNCSRNIANNILIQENVCCWIVETGRKTFRPHYYQNKWMTTNYDLQNFFILPAWKSRHFLPNAVYYMGQELTLALDGLLIYQFKCTTCMEWRK